MALGFVGRVGGPFVFDAARHGSARHDPWHRRDRIHQAGPVSWRGVQPDEHDGVPRHREWVLFEGVQKFELWVDSVSIPARLIQDRSGIGMDMGGGKREGVRFSANRHRYRQGTSGAMVLPEESYDLSGVRIETGGAWLVFADRWGNTTHWDLGVPRTLPKQYAP